MKDEWVDIPFVDGLYGLPIHVGDYIAYPRSAGSTGFLNTGIVLKIQENTEEDWRGRKCQRMQVKSIQREWSDNNRIKNVWIREHQRALNISNSLVSFLNEIVENCDE